MIVEDLTKADLIFYAVNPDGVIQALDVAKSIGKFSSLKIGTKFAVPGELDEWHTKQQREKESNFSDQDRLLAWYTFNNTELSLQEGAHNDPIPDGKPVFIFHPVYFHGKYDVSVDQSMSLLKGAHQKIANQAPTSPTVVCFPDFPYELSHNRKKHLEKYGHDESEHLSDVIFTLRSRGVNGLLTYYVHAPDEIRSLISGPITLDKIVHENFPPIEWINVNPYHGLSLNGEPINYLDDRISSIMDSVVPYDRYIQNAKDEGHKVSLILPDQGAKKKFEEKIKELDLPYVPLIKRRFGEGKIDIFIDPEFDFKGYILSLDLKDGDIVELILTEDFLNTGGTGNKSSGLVKQRFWKEVKELYSNSNIPDIKITTTLLVAHAKTENPYQLKLWNINKIIYADTSVRYRELIPPELEVIYRKIRRLEQDGIPTSWQPHKTIAKKISCSNGLAASVLTMYNQLTAK